MANCVRQTKSLRPLSAVLLAGLLATGPVVGQETEPEGDWPQLLGPGRDGVSTESNRLEAWSQEGPAVLWRRPVGSGFAGPAVVRGRLVLFHRLGDEEVVALLDASSGKELWSHTYPTSYRDDFGFDEGPRATPTVAGDRIVTFGSQGVLTCLDLESGDRIWQVETHERFAVRKGFFGAAGSPLVEGELVIVNVGGPDEAGIVAFELDSGRPVWRATDHEASYASGIAATLGGRRAALFFTRAGLVGLRPRSGELWLYYPWRSRSRSSVNAATPLVVGNRIFLSASYGTGAVVLEVEDQGVEALWSSNEVLSNHYATSVYHDGHLYGFHGRQERGPSLRAVVLATGEVAWSADRFGAGSVIRVTDQLLVLGEDGVLTLAAASPQAFSPAASAKILQAPVRAYPAFARGRLFARDEDELICVRLR